MGQWVGCEANLPRYKSAVDRRSPEPPKIALAAYIEEYKKQKADAQMFDVFVNIAEHSAEVRNVSQSSESLQNISLGVGVGVGIGEGVGVGEEQGKTERVSLSFSSAKSGEDTVKEIAYEHPKLHHLAANNKPIPSGLERKIWERIAEDGKDLILAGTRNLRDAVAKWPPGNDRYIPNPLRFYDEREYLKDPKEWDRPERQAKSYGGDY